MIGSVKDVLEQIDGFGVGAGMGIIRRDFQVGVRVIPHQPEESSPFCVPVLIGQQEGAFVAGAKIKRIAREGGVSELEGLLRAARFAQQKNSQMRCLLIVGVACESAFDMFQSLQQSCALRL